MELAGVTTLSRFDYWNYLQGGKVDMDVAKHCSSQGLGWNNFNSNMHGFTLIELLVTLAVTSILALNVFPSLSAIIAQNRSAVLTNNLNSALSYARSLAITKQALVITCQSNNGSECNRSDNWHNGWIIFTDKNNNKQRDLNEPLIHVFSALNNGTSATFNGSGGIDHYIRYKPSGQAHPNGSFLICNPDIGVGKALIMHHSGRLRLSKKQTNGSAITC